MLEMFFFALFDCLFCVKNIIESLKNFVKLLGLFLIRCVFTKKILGGQKFVKTGTGKNRGFAEHCAMGIQCSFVPSKFSFLDVGRNELNRKNTLTLWSI